MNNKYRRQLWRLDRRHEWKLRDDQSGFQIYSGDAVLNGETGVITHRKDWDSPTYDSIAFSWPGETILPIVKPERFDFLPNTALSEVPITWDTDETEWQLESSNWEHVQWQLLDP